DAYSFLRSAGSPRSTCGAPGRSPAAIHSVWSAPLAGRSGSGRERLNQPREQFRVVRGGELLDLADKAGVVGIHRRLGAVLVTFAKAVEDLEVLGQRVFDRAVASGDHVQDLLEGDEGVVP